MSGKRKTTSLTSKSQKKIRYVSSWKNKDLMKCIIRDEQKR